MNKKGLIFAFSVFGAVTLGIVGMAGFAAPKGQSVFSKASAENEVYKLNTKLNFGAEYVADTGAAGDKYNGVDGYHFVATASSSSGTDWHIKMWNFGGDWSLTVDTKYTLTYEIKVVSSPNATFNVIAAAGDGVKDMWREDDIPAADYGKYLTFSTDFTATKVNGQFELHFGKNTLEAEKTFEVLVRRFEVRVKDSAEVFASCYLESPNDFQNRWNTAHAEKGLCDASDETVKALLKLYTELPTWARDQVRAKTALYPYEGKGVTLGDQIDYFAERVHVSFE